MYALEYFCVGAGPIARGNAADAAAARRSRLHVQNPDMPSIRHPASRALRSAAPLTLAIALLAAGCASTPSTATSAAQAPDAAGPAATGDDAAAQQQQRFAQWVANFRATAAAGGISEATLRTALDAVQYLPRVIELDRAQPEFTRTVWEYLDNTASAQRIATGQDKLQQVRADTDAAAAR